MKRRDVLRFGGGALLGGVFTAAGVTALPRAEAAPSTNEASRPSPEPAPIRDARLLSFFNTHTSETFADAYWRGGDYVGDALSAINQLMRDHRTGEVHPIDPRLLDQLHTLKGLVETSAPFQIISGYRSPRTNAALAANSNGVATRSLHMQGRAIDIRVQGVPLARLRDAALSMGAGGVGY